MLNITRQQKIHSLLKSKGSASISELRGMFGVSEMTIGFEEVQGQGNDRVMQVGRYRRVYQR